MYNFSSSIKNSLIVLNASAKGGNTTFLINEFTNNIDNKVPTVYFDKNMTEREFNTRLLSNMTGVERIKIENHTSEEFELIQIAVDKATNKSFVYIHDSYITNKQIYEKCKNLKQSIGLQVAIISCVRGDINNTINFIKDKLCSELNLTVIIAIQTNAVNQVKKDVYNNPYGDISLLLKSKTNEEILKDGEDCGNYKLYVQSNALNKKTHNNCVDIVLDANKVKIARI